jgi:hypothetical protein
MVYFLTVKTEKEKGRKKHYQMNQQYIGRGIGASVGGFAKLNRHRRMNRRSIC